MPAVRGSLVIPGRGRLGTAGAVVVKPTVIGSRVTAVGPAPEPTSLPLPALIGGSTAMGQLLETVRRISETTVSVVIHGETGSGKELVARMVHDCSRRHAGPFCAVNCAALPGSLIESALFGHERGAFTGATQTQVGVFERASGGTLLLDEVGELKPSAQAALLRALETRRICRVGGRSEIPVDVRVVAATHRDLQDRVAAGKFRSDLLYRLNTIVLEVPPLRDRLDEVPALVAIFVRRASEEWHRPPPRIDSHAMQALQRYSFPGNVRELKNLTERAVAVCSGGVVTLSDFPDNIQALAEPPASSRVAVVEPPSSVSEMPRPIRVRLREYERQLFAEVLEAARGNQARAAELAGLPLRTFSRRLNQLGVRRSPSLRPSASSK